MAHIATQSFGCEWRRDDGINILGSGRDTVIAMHRQPRGLFRVRIEGALSDLVRIKAGGLEFSIPEELYNEKGIEPPLKDLPWQGEAADEKQPSALGDNVSH